MQVAKWGNSLGVRLPKALVVSMGITHGDELELVPQRSKKNSFVAVVNHAPSKLERLQAMRQFRASMPADFKFDREEANAR